MECSDDSTGAVAAAYVNKDESAPRVIRRVLAADDDLAWRSEFA